MTIYTYCACSYSYANLQKTRERISKKQRNITCNRLRKKAVNTARFSQNSVVLAAVHQIKTRRTTRQFKAENQIYRLSACPKKANFSTINSKLFSHPPAPLPMTMCTPAGCWQGFASRAVSGTWVISLRVCRTFLHNADGICAHGFL